MPPNLEDELAENEKVVNGIFNFFSKLTSGQTFCLFVIIIFLIFGIFIIFLVYYPDLVRLVVTGLVSAAIGGGAGAYIGTKMAIK
jgi:hypothetical protein